MDSSGSSWLPTQVLLLQISLLLRFQAVTDPSSSCTLNRTLGGSIQLQLTSQSFLSPNVPEIEWIWDSEYTKKQFLVSLKPNNFNPQWYDLEDKYKHRFYLTEMSFLNIQDLTMEMSGLYVATIKFFSGVSQQEFFRLCVYEPIPHPKIVIHSSFNTSGWCNVSLECGTPGATESLTMTWLSKGLPRELEQRGTLMPGPNSRNLSLSLPLSQLNGHLTCVVSNPADQKKATLDLETICPWRGGSTLLPVVPSSGAAPHILSAENFADLQTGGVNSHDLPYTEISLPRYPKNNMEKRSFHAQSPKLTLAIHTVYEKIRPNPESKGDT